MLGLMRGFLGGLIAAATMAGGLRAIGRGEKLPTEGLSQTLWQLGKTMTASSNPLLTLQAARGRKGGETTACPPKGSMHQFAKCPGCGKRGHEHESA